MQFVINWNVNPEIIRFGFIAVRWYGLLFASGFLVGAAIGHWIFKRENKSSDSLDRVILYMLIGTVIGARLGEVLFYNPSYYFSHPLEIFKIWKGGLASHGAGIGLLLALYFYSKRSKDQSYVWILDRASITIALGCALIRIGNLFNSEIIGIPTRGNFGFVFERIDLLPRHPAQLYESAAYLLIFLLLLLLYVKNTAFKQPGLMTGICLTTMLSARFVLEFYKENQVQFETGMVFNMGQILSIPMFCLGIFIIIKYAKRKPVHR